MVLHLLTNFKFALLINIPIKAIFIFTNRLLSPQHFCMIFVTSLIHSPTPKEGCYRIPPLSSNCPQPLECLHCANHWPSTHPLPQFSTIPHQNGQIQIVVVAFSSLALLCSFEVLQSRSRFNKFGVDLVFGPQTGPIITVMGMGALVAIQ